MHRLALSNQPASPQGPAKDMRLWLTSDEEKTGFHRAIKNGAGVWSIALANLDAGAHLHGHLRGSLGKRDGKQAKVRGVGALVVVRSAGDRGGDLAANMGGARSRSILH